MAKRKTKSSGKTALDLFLDSMRGVHQALSPLIESEKKRVVRMWFAYFHDPKDQQAAVQTAGLISDCWPTNKF